MSNVNKVKLEGVEHDIEDTQARQIAQAAQSAASTAQTNSQNAIATAESAQAAAQSAQSTASTAQTTADEAKAAAEAAQESAEQGANAAQTNVAHKATVLASSWVQGESSFGEVTWHKSVVTDANIKKSDVVLIYPADANSGNIMLDRIRGHVDTADGSMTLYANQIPIQNFDIFYTISKQKEEK